jgi:hypothetical protein
MAIRLFDDPVPDMKTAMARAEAGARYLDQRYGDDWHTLIDADRLDISSPCRCVLGQLIGHGYYSALFTSGRDGVDGGFSCGAWDILFFALPPSVKRSFQRLTTAWKIVLQRRTAQRVGRNRQRVCEFVRTCNRTATHRRRAAKSCSA